jgi:hypothetical protein
VRAFKTVSPVLPCALAASAAPRLALLCAVAGHGAELTAGRLLNRPTGVLGDEAKAAMKFAMPSCTCAASSRHLLSARTPPPHGDRAGHHGRPPPSSSKSGRSASSPPSVSTLLRSLAHPLRPAPATQAPRAPDRWGSNHPDPPCASTKGGRRSPPFCR